MKLKALRFILPLTAIALVMPADVSATCLTGKYRLPVNVIPESAKGVGGSAAFGGGLTTIGGHGQLQLNPTLAVLGLLSFCSTSGSSTIAIGGILGAQVFEAEDGLTTVQAMGGLNTASFSGTRTTSLPFSVYVLRSLNEMATLFAGPSFTWQRVSNSGFSGSNDNLGFQAGITYQATPEVSLSAGFDYQDFAGGSNSSLNLSADYQISY